MRDLLERAADWIRGNQGFLDDEYGARQLVAEIEEALRADAVIVDVRLWESMARKLANQSLHVTGPERARLVEEAANYAFVADHFRQTENL